MKFNYLVTRGITCQMMLGSVVFILLVCFTQPGISFRKVLVPAVYKEFINGKPQWMTDQSIMDQYGYELFLYQKLNSSAPNYIAMNRGTEGAVYLRYIVDHYDNFPDVAMFVHAHPHEHQKRWLELLGCVNPNATYININFDFKSYRMPVFWNNIELWIEQCWRDVLQITYDLKNNTQEFLTRIPPKQILSVSYIAGQQFILSRGMVRKRRKQVWRDLLQIIGNQTVCHKGLPDYNVLRSFEKYGEVGPEPEHLSNYSFKKGLPYDKPNSGYGRHTQGGAMEHLAHVIFGGYDLDMSFPDMNVYCQNFLPNCPGSPCIK